jgi:xylulokinase
VPLDAAGDPTYYTIAWYDSRTEPQVEWLDAHIGKDALFAVSGLSLQPIFGLCKLLWLKQNEPDAFTRTVRWLHVSDYVAYQLSGAAATDYSLASRVLALDLARGAWSDEVLNAAGIDGRLFAPLTTSGTRIGAVTPEAAALTGLPAGAAVSVGGHDHVVGAFGVGVTEPGMMLDSMGTAETIFVTLDAPLTDPAMGRQGFTQGAHVVPGRFYVIGSTYTSGAAMAWLRESAGDAPYETLIAEAEAVPVASGGVVFLPHLRLASPPHDDPLARGAFIGLTTGATRGALFRAVMEGLAYDCRAMLDALLAFPEVAPVTDIRPIGGSTRNRALMGIKASVFNRPLTLTGVSDATCLGAALLAGLGAGVYADADDAQRTVAHALSRVEPDAGAVALYERVYQDVYRALYPALAPLHHRLSRTV